MKKNLLRLVFCFTLFSISLTSNAQSPTFDCYLTNDTFLSPTIYQFDLYLLQTGTIAFEYENGQYGIIVSSACANGGTLKDSIVAGSSQLGSQAPTNITLPSTYVMNVAPRGAAGCGNGPIISNIDSGCSAPGTRVATFRIFNTVAFSCTCLNLTFNFTAGAGRTATGVYACVAAGDSAITANGTFYSYNTSGNCLKYCATAISETFFNNVLSVYPNPSSSEIRINASAIRWNEAITISISNALGSVIRTEKKNWQKDITVDTKSLIEGIYFLKVSSSDGEWVGRFMKQ